MSRPPGHRGARRRRGCSRTALAGGRAGSARGRRHWPCPLPATGSESSQGSRRPPSLPLPPLPGASEEGGKAAVTHNSNIHWPCSTRLQLEPPSTCTRLRGSPGLPAGKEETEEEAARPSSAARSRAAVAAMSDPRAPGSEGARGVAGARRGRWAGAVGRRPLSASLRRAVLRPPGLRLLTGNTSRFYSSGPSSSSQQRHTADAAAPPSWPLRSSRIRFMRLLLGRP